MNEDVGRIGLRLRLPGDERLSVGIQQRRQIFPDGGVYERAEAETVAVFQNELPHLVVPRLRAKVTLHAESFPFSTRSNTPTKNGSSKKTVSFQ